jgi:hypothetical protein
VQRTIWASVCALGFAASIIAGLTAPAVVAAGPAGTVTTDGSHWT